MTDVPKLHALVGAAAAVDDEPDREWTPDTIRAEHQSVMASFTPIQARALARINRAFRESRMSNRSARDAMEEIYATEAVERNAERSRRSGGDLEAGTNDASPSDDRYPPNLRAPDSHDAPPVTPRPPGAPSLEAAPSDGAQSAPEGYSDTDGSW